MTCKDCLHHETENMPAEAARAAGLKPRCARAALDDVRSAVADWPRFATEAAVRDDFASEISRQLSTSAQ